MAAALNADLSNEPTLFGHPRALYVLFFAELWERFCYYGMRAFLALHIASVFFNGVDNSQAMASASYGGFTALIYALGIFGGTVADRVLGYQRSILLGGSLMAIGEFLLISGDRTTFYFGLAAMIVGNGLFKPNISTLVGKLYRPGDPRRDGGFTIFYMGINVGAALAPIACQWISYHFGTLTPTLADAGHITPDYRYGFGLAGAGMLLGLVCFGGFAKMLGDKGLPPAGKEGFGSLLLVVIGAIVVTPGVYLLLSLKDDVVGYILYATFAVMGVIILVAALKEEIQVRQRMFVLLLLLLLNSVFWMGFEQAGNSLNFFAQKQLIPFSVGSWSMPSEWWQSVNAVLVVAIGPIFASMWLKLHARGINPPIPTKFGFGFLGMGLGFLVIVTGINQASADGMVFWYFLLGLYFVHTMGELCLSPVGLSMVTKLAPARMTGMIMGAWFISIATGNFLAGKISTQAADHAKAAADALGKVHAYGDVFTKMIYLGVGLGLVVIISSRWINKWMHGVK